MDQAEAEEAADRVIAAMGKFTLLKQELDWYRREENRVYHDIRHSIAMAICPPNHPNPTP